jgi:hypothetical protein
MHIVELDVDYVLDARVKVTFLGLRCFGFSRGDGHEAHGQAHWRTCGD